MIRSLKLAVEGRGAYKDTRVPESGRQVLTVGPVRCGEHSEGKVSSKGAVRRVTGLPGILWTNAITS